MTFSISWRSTSRELSSSYILKLQRSLSSEDLASKLTQFCPWFLNCLPCPHQVDGLEKLLEFEDSTPVIIQYSEISCNCNTSKNWFLQTWTQDFLMFDPCWDLQNYTWRKCSFLVFVYFMAWFLVMYYVWMEFFLKKKTHKFWCNDYTKYIFVPLKSHELYVPALMGLQRFF